MLDRSYANFSERRQREVQLRRIRLLSTWVNRALADAVDALRWHHALVGKGINKEAARLSSILIRLGGVAAMVSSALYLSAELLDLPDSAVWRSYYGFLPGGGSLSLTRS